MEDYLMNDLTQSDTHVHQAWFPYMAQDVQAQVKRIIAELTHLVEDERKTIYPPLPLIFRAMQLTAPDKVKVIIIGQDPYHGPNQANGLSFSVNAGVALPPSLRNIYLELVNDVHVPAPTTGDLTPWAREGVLLLNASLSVEEHKPNSHAYLQWELVTAEILRVALLFPSPKVFLCWGNFAYKVAQAAITTAKQEGHVPEVCIIRSTHPSPFSAHTSTASAPAFIGSHPFSQANAYLKAHGVMPVDWSLP